MVLCDAQVRSFLIFSSEWEVTRWSERRLCWWWSTVQEGVTIRELSHSAWCCDQMGRHGKHLASYLLRWVSSSAWRTPSPVDRSDSEPTNTQRKNDRGTGNCYFLSVLKHGWCLHLIVVRGLEYVSDPESYTSGSVATGRASLAGQVKG